MAVQHLGGVAALIEEEVQIAAHALHPLDQRVGWQALAQACGDLGGAMRSDLDRRKQGKAKSPKSGFGGVSRYSSKPSTWVAYVSQMHLAIFCAI